MGLTAGDYWYEGDDPSLELVERVGSELHVNHAKSKAAEDMERLRALMTQARELADKLAPVSIGYARDYDNNGGSALGGQVRGGLMRDVLELDEADIVAAIESYVRATWKLQRGVPRVKLTKTIVHADRPGEETAIELSARVDFTPVTEGKD